jgi:hypothetical protein
MDGGFCGYPIQSTDLVDVDWTVGGFHAGLVDVGESGSDIPTHHFTTIYTPFYYSVHTSFNTVYTVFYYNIHTMYTH